MSAKRCASSAAPPVRGRSATPRWALWPATPARSTRRCCSGEALADGGGARDSPPAPSRSRLAGRGALLGGLPGGPRLGMPVEVTFERVDDRLVLPAFRCVTPRG